MMDDEFDKYDEDDDGYITLADLESIIADMELHARGVGTTRTVLWRLMIIGPQRFALFPHDVGRACSASLDGLESSID